MSIPEVPEGASLIATLLALVGGGFWIKRQNASTNSAVASEETLAAIQHGYTEEVMRLQKLVAMLGPLHVRIAELEANAAGAASLLAAVCLCKACTDVNTELIERIKHQMGKLVPRIERRKPHEPGAPLNAEVRKIVADFHQQQYGSAE